MKKQARGRVLVLGATSGIATAIAHRFAAKGHALRLAARDAETLEQTAADLRIRHGVDVDTFALDALDDSAPGAVASNMDDIEGVVLAIGLLGDQEASQQDPALLQRVLATNFTACAGLLEAAAGPLDARGAGWICAISSVAGDRGRMSNYHMGSAKAGLTAFLQGLRNRLHHAGVAVITVKPGFVDTPMTYGKEGMFLVASPDKVAKDIEKAVRRRRATIYTPWFWRPILFIIRSVPTAIFNRLRL